MARGLVGMIKCDALIAPCTNTLTSYIVYENVYWVVGKYLNLFDIVCNFIAVISPIKSIEEIRVFIIPFFLSKTSNVDVH